MDHREYVRIVPGSKNAVLMIHGIAGSPAHFRDLLPAVPDSWSVYNILLDGHGKTVADFSATSMKKWKTQVSDVLRQLLDRYEKIVVVAHSMGTLFAMDAAVEHPNRIVGLFLLAVPLRVHLPLSTVGASLRVALGKMQGHTVAEAMAADSSIRMGGPLYRYIGWIPRMVELMREIRATRKRLPQVDVPCEVFQSRADELVSPKTICDLEKNPAIKVTVLENSGHFSYGADDAALLCRQLGEMLK